MIAVIDYGMGNIHSIKKALEACGGKTLVTNSPADIRKCKKLVLPGVGAFSDAMRELAKRGLVEAIRSEVRSGKIFLGICLGMQLLFDRSAEAPGVKGLGLIKGSVVKFKVRPGLLIPQMGWNSLRFSEKCTPTTNDQRPTTVMCSLLRGLSRGSYVYFCHSYYASPRDKKVIAASCDYGADFAAVVRKDNIYGVQFHPEKSQSTGIRILKNFVKL